MTNRTIVALVALAAILGIIFLVSRRDNNAEATEPILSITAFNQTKNQDATQSSASPKDVIVYTLTAENHSDKVIAGYVIESNISDLTELSTLIDAQGANYNSANNSLVWTPLDIPAQGSIQKGFNMRVKEDFPEGSDLVMTAKFNNEVKVSVSKQQVAGQSTQNAAGSPTDYKAPQTGIPLTISLLLSAFITFGLILFHLARKINITN